MSTCLMTVFPHWISGRIKALRKALTEKVGDSTIIIVAQRINTVLDADQIVVMDEGRIAGQRHSRRAACSPASVYKEIALVAAE